MTAPIRRHACVRTITPWNKRRDVADALAGANQYERTAKHLSLAEGVATGPAVAEARRWKGKASYFLAEDHYGRKRSRQLLPLLCITDVTLHPKQSVSGSESTDGLD